MTLAGAGAVAGLDGGGFTICGPRKRSMPTKRLEIGVRGIRSDPQKCFKVNSRVARVQTVISTVWRVETGKKHFERFLFFIPYGPGIGLGVWTRKYGFEGS